MTASGNAANHPDLARRIGYRVKTLRERLGESQDRFADRLDLSRSMVCRVEGAHRMPSLPTIITFARGLGCTVDDLVGDV